MDAFKLLSGFFSPEGIIYIVVVLATSGLVSGLSGFGFSAIGALCLWLIPPKLGVPLLMCLSAANQMLSLGQLKADLKPIREWWPNGPAPYLLGGLAGAPVGLTLLHALPTGILMLVFGALLTLYAAYSVFKPASLKVEISDNPAISVVVGFVGGVIGGFTAFPGAAVVVWSGLRQLSKKEGRSIVQPYILGMQFLSLGLLVLQRPQTFNGEFWALLMVTAPVVLPGTLMGVALYRRISDLNFRKVTFAMLGVSGVVLLVKAASATSLVAAITKVAFGGMLGRG